VSERERERERGSGEFLVLPRSGRVGRQVGWLAGSVYIHADADARASICTLHHGQCWAGMTPRRANARFSTLAPNNAGGWASSAN